MGQASNVAGQVAHANHATTALPNVINSGGRHRGLVPSTVVCGTVVDVDFAESNRLQHRLHDLVPGGAHTYARGCRPVPRGHGPGHSSAAAVRGRGRRRQHVRRVRHRAALGDARPRLPAGQRGGDAGRSPTASTSAARRCSSWTRPRRSSRRSRAPTWSSSPRTARTRRTAPSSWPGPPPAATLVARCSSQPFFSTGDWFIAHHGRCAPAPARTSATATVRLRLQRPGLACETVLDQHRGPGRVRRPRARLGGRRARARVPRGRPPARRRARCRPGLRRDDHRHALVARTAPSTSTASTPDLSTWGKGLGNGFAISALAGRRELMELGGLRTTEPRVFLLSTTYGAESVGLAAYLAVEHEYRTWDVVGALEARGTPGSPTRSPGSWTRQVSPSTCGSAVVRRAWSSRPWTLRATRRRPTAPCSCRSCSSAGCSPSRWSSRRHTATTTSRGPWRPSRAPSTCTRRRSRPAAPTACSAAGRWHPHSRTRRSAAPQRLPNLGGCGGRSLK